MDSNITGVGRITLDMAMEYGQKSLELSMMERGIKAVDKAMEYRSGQMEKDMMESISLVSNTAME